MSLHDAMKRLHQMEESGATSARVHDSDSGLELSRGSGGELLVTLEYGDRWATVDYKDLVAGPCSGIRGAALQEAIIDAMQDAMAAKYRGQPRGNGADGELEDSERAAGDRKVKERKEDW